MKYLLLIFFIVSVFFLNAQEKESESIFDKINDKNNNISINQEYRIKALVNEHVKINEKQEGLDGYRIRIYSAKGSNARKNALEEKAEFMKKHPYVQSYISYKPPNFRIVIGNFRTKSEAEKFRLEIERDYPNAFIIKDIIEFPKL